VDRTRRIFTEAGYVAARFSRSRRVRVHPGPGGTWRLIIYDFPLPAGFNRRTTAVLVCIPPEYPEVPPSWFYVKRGLRYRGRRLPHYYEDFVPSALRRQGWAGCCVHIVEWRPAEKPLSGHSLLSFCEVISEFFERGARELDRE